MAYPEILYRIYRRRSQTQPSISSLAQQEPPCKCGIYGARVRLLTPYFRVCGSNSGRTRGILRSEGPVAKLYEGPGPDRRTRCANRAFPYTPTCAPYADAGSTHLRQGRGPWGACPTQRGLRAPCGAPRARCGSRAMCRSRGAVCALRVRGVRGCVGFAMWDTDAPPPRVSDPGLPGGWGSYCAGVAVWVCVVPLHTVRSLTWVRFLRNPTWHGPCVPCVSVLTSRVGWTRPRQARALHSPARRCAGSARALRPRHEQGSTRVGPLSSGRVSNAVLLPPAGPRDPRSDLPPRARSVRSPWLR